MPADNGTSVFVGGGIAGLFGALMLAERRPGSRIVLVERESDLGGLLRAFDYGEHGRFDYGMHNIYDTGLAGLDERVAGLLPESEWQVSEGNARDLAGIFFHGRLQTNTPYIDLRHQPYALHQECVAGFFEAASDLGEPARAASAAEEATAKFGGAIAENLIRPVLQKLYRRAAENLDPLALRLTALGRIAMFDEPLTLELMRSPHLRSRIAYPEQRRLPAEFVPPLKTYYPKRYGIHRIVDALKERLARNNVTLITSAQVVAICRAGQRVTSVTLERAGERTTIDGVAELYWSAGPQFVAPLLVDKMPPLPFERGARTVVVSMLLDREPDMDGLYYFYCYEPGFDTFRMTNFTAYCDGAPRNGLFPVTLEFLMYDQKDKQALEAQARRELQHFGVLPSGASIKFCQAEVLASGFPLPSVTNMTSLSTLRRLVADSEIENLHLLGILAEPGLFFQGDILKHVYRTFEHAA